LSTPLDLRFVMSATGVAQLPASTAEIATVGRSNVGKSSLINALANRKSLAKVSNTPGRTQLLNFFELSTGGSIVDLPGYGYSAASKKARSDWPTMVPGYLLGRPELRSVMLLVDGEIGPTPLDVNTIDWLTDHDVAFNVVATKHDKVKPSKRARRITELAAGCRLEPEQVVWVSSAKGTGIDTLRGLVRAWLKGP
jgi:GTP-binding protein